MEPTTCLICNESVLNGSLNSKTKKTRASDGGLQLISDNKSKFALTNSQYLILQKVLSLPVDTCKSELINGPYCKECFTNINNVCHIMSALENLQESIQEFRKDFGTKMTASFDIGAGSSTSSSSGRKRKSLSTLRSASGDEEWNRVRQIVLDCLKKNSFMLSQTQQSVPTGQLAKPKHLHEIISEIDPDNRNIDANLVLFTTNGDMPTGPRSKRPTKKSQALLSSQKSSKTTISKSLVSVSESETGKYICEYQNCKKRYTDLRNLNHHVQQIHYNDEYGEYICWYCKDKFNTTENLKEHEKIHTGSRKCPVCKKVFGRVNTLNRHMLTHPNSTRTKTKPSSLPVLQLVENKTDNRKKSNRPACDVCKKKFPNNKTMINHRAKVHKKVNDNGIVKIKWSSRNKPLQLNVFRPTRCKVCSRIVTDLSSHMKSVHPGVAGITNGNNNASKISVNKLRPGPASMKKRALENKLCDKEPIDSIETSSTSKLNLDESVITEKDVNKDHSSLINDKKTENGAQELVQEKDKSLAKKEERSQLIEETPVKTLDPPPSPPLPPPFTSTQTSKYQFKNLLKLGDKKE